MTALPPAWLIRAAIAAVWLYEGIGCKLLGGDPRQREIVTAVARLGPRFGRLFLTVLGLAEALLGLWALSGIWPIPCAMVQTILLCLLNTGGILWARHLIHDPMGMVVKNAAFLVLAWVSASLPRGW